MSDAREVDRLRARVADLEAQLRQESSAVPVGRTERSPWRAVASAMVIIVACVLAPVSVVAAWVNVGLSDPVAYVETVAPLADNPAVQAALADRVTSAVLAAVDVQGLATDALSAVAEQPNVPPRVAAALPGLAIPLAQGVESFTEDRVDAFVAGPEFAALWRQANEVAHEQVLRLLSGEQGGALSAQADSVTVNLGPIIDEVTRRLVAEGFSLAERIPSIETSFVLVHSESVGVLQRGYSALTTLGLWLPLVVLALVAAGVALARDRRAALLRAALGVTAGMLALGVTLALARGWYMATTPGDMLTPQAAGEVFDIIVRFMRTALRMVAVAGLVLALGAALAGPSRTAVGARRSAEDVLGALRGSAESAGWRTGPLGPWVHAHRRELQGAAAFAGGLAVVFWDRPSTWVVVGITAVVLLLVAVVEFLATPSAVPPLADASAG